MAPLRASQGPALRRVAHDLGLGGIQVVITSKLGIATVLQADRALRATPSRFSALARFHRRLDIVEQFPRTTVQEVPV